MRSADLHRSESRLTHHDLDALPEEEGTRYELIDGKLHTWTFPSMAHQRVLTGLAGMIGMYLDAQQLGEIFGIGTKVVLEDVTCVGPDLIYIADAHLGGLEKDGFYGPPDLIVEVTSPEPSVDRVVKHRKYAQKGVRNYWIIDPEARTLEAFELRKRSYKLVTTVKSNGTFSPALFPGLQIKLSRLFD